MKKQTKPLKVKPIKVQSLEHLRELQGLPSDYDTLDQKEKDIWNEIMGAENLYGN